MKTRMKKIAVVLATVIAAGATLDAIAGEGNAKRGRVYFKMVCTACHLSNAGFTIPPSSMTMAEWGSYMDADKHDKTGATNSSVKYYLSQEYRKSISDNNRAAKKFIKLPNEKLFADVRAFTVSGAKDSDTPASCE